MATAHDKSTELEHAIDAATEAVRITASKLDEPSVRRVRSMHKATNAPLV